MLGNVRNCLVGCLITGSLIGQNNPPVPGDTLLTLHRAGVPTQELIRLIDERGAAPVDEVGLVSLREGGLPGEVLRRLAQVPPKASDVITTPKVVMLTENGVPPAEILRRIRESDSRFEVTIDDVLSLAKAGVDPEVIKEIRSRPPGTLAKPTPEQLTLEDIVALATEGVPPEVIVGKIEDQDARFSVTVDDILALSRKGVPETVLKSIWSRALPTAAATKPDPNSEREPTPVQAPDPSTPEAPELSIHREPSGGFSIVVPTGFAIHREGRNANSLVSFTDGALTEPDAMAPAELQVLRYRSRKPEWLVERNLPAVGDRFITMLQAGYAKKGLSMTHGEGTATWLSGRPARTYQLGSSAADGTTHEGRIYVTWTSDQVFVVSWAVRADLSGRVGPMLERCARSLTFEDGTQLEVPPSTDAIPFLFETWSRAVTRYDYGSFRQIVGAQNDSAEQRTRFVDANQRFTDPRIRISLSESKEEGDTAVAVGRILGPQGIETIRLPFRRTGNRWQLDSLLKK